MESSVYLFFNFLLNIYNIELDGSWFFISGLIGISFVLLLNKHLEMKDKTQLIFPTVCYLVFVFACVYWLYFR